MAAVFLQKDNAWREFLNPLRGLSMDRIMQLVEQGERGAYADLQWFYQAMERSDALIATVVMRRRAALLSSQWDVRPEREPTDPVLAREQAAFLRDEYDKVGNLRECVAFLSTATFRGYAHAEKHYDGKGGVMRLEPVEQWFWCREGMFGEWTYNREARSGVTAGERVRIALTGVCAVGATLFANVDGSVSKRDAPSAGAVCVGFAEEPGVDGQAVRVRPCLCRW
jgi:hypothetical protein